MYLQQDTLTANCRSDADIGDSGLRLSAGEVCPDCVDPPDRNIVMWQHDIGGRKTYRPAPSVAMSDPALNGIAIAQQVFGKIKVILPQGFPDSGAADPLSRNDVGIHGTDTETPSFTEFAQQVNISYTFSTKAEIIANDDVPDPEPVDEVFLHKIFRRSLCQRLVEAKRKHLIDAGFRQLFDLVPPAQQTRRGVLRTEEFVRMRLEGHCRSFDAERLGLLFEKTQQAHMTHMNAIEIADGHHRGPVSFLNIIKIANQYNAVLKLSVTEMPTRVDLLQSPGREAGEAKSLLRNAESMPDAVQDGASTDNHHRYQTPPPKAP